MVRQVKAVLLSTVLALSLLPLSIASGETVPDEQFNNFLHANSNQVAAYWTESVEAIPPSSSLIGTDPTVESEIKTDMCDSLFDEKCLKFGRFIWASFSDFCDDSNIKSSSNPVTSISFNCIDQVIAKDALGNQVAVSAQTPELIRKVNPELEGNYKGTNLLIPKGSQRSIVRIPGAIHKGGTDTYLVDMYMSGDFTRTGSGQGVCATNLDYTACIKNGAENKFFASIKPIFSTKSQLRGYDKSSLFDKTRIFLGIAGSTLQCEIFEEGLCWKLAGFPDGYTFGLKMKISIGTLNGWLHGRALMDDFETSSLAITRGKIDVPTQLISLVGKPSKVAIAGGLKDDSTLTEMMAALRITTIRTFFCNSFWSNFCLDRFIGFAPLIGDTALASPQIWSVRNIRSSDLYNLEKNTQECIRKESGVSGYVSTNATAYSSGPPSFNISERSLDYRVASTHFNKDGSLNKGNYSLVLKSQVAKCIYGFDSSPVSATISVISEAGASVVASTTLQSNSEWIKLKTDNFTFSTPTLRVKLEAEPRQLPVKPVAEKPTNVLKKSTLICTKGKLTKKITAANPKCPAGYKKK